MAKPLIGSQNEFGATQKYMKIKSYKWNIPTIFLFNPEDYIKGGEKSAMHDIELEAYGRRNCIVVRLPWQMYTPV